MSTSHRRSLRIAAPFVLLLLAAAPAAAQITSTTAGGPWSDAATWIGGRTPTAADDVVVAGPVTVRTGNACRNLTVQASGRITDAPGGSALEEFVVQGDLVNRGIVLRDPSLRVRVRGNLHNVGTWAPSTVVLDGVAPQRLSLEGVAVFTREIKVENASGVEAASDLSFRDGTLDLEGGRLEMDGRVLDADATFGFEDGILAGPMTLRGTLQSYTASLLLEGDITNEGIIENSPAGGATDVLRVRGQLVNRGTIRSYPLRIELDGSAHNAGVWDNGETRFEGWEDQRLSHEAGATLSGGWSTAGDFVTVTATSPIVFVDADVDLDGGRLRMGDHPLRLEAGARLYDGRLDARALAASGGARIGGSLRIAPSITLYGTVQVHTGTVFEGTVVVADTLRDAPGGSATEAVQMLGSLRNEGVIQGSGLRLEAYGDLDNAGEWRNGDTYLLGTARRTIRGAPIASTLTVAGQGVALAGDLVLHALTISSGGSAYLSGDASLHLPGGGLRGSTGNFVNYGRVVMHRPVVANRTLDFYGASAKTPAALDFDTLFVETYGHQVPPTFTGAVLTWWRLRPTPSSEATLPELTFGYEESLLGANEEETLEVFHSADGGATWRQLSTSLNLERDPDDNRITLLNAPASGDFALSSEANPVAAVPNILLSITGRSNIRVGAPSRYHIHYVNNSDQPTGDMLMAVRVDPGAHILRIEPSTAPGTSVRPFGPEDLFVEEVMGDTVAFLFLHSMDPREERTFTVVAEGDADLERSGPQKVQSDPITLSAFLLYLGVAILVDYIQDVAVNYLEEMTASEARDLLDEAIRRTNEEWFGGYEKPGESIILLALEKAFQRIFGIVTLPLDFIKLFAYDIWVALFRGGERYINSPSNCRLRPGGRVPAQAPWGPWPDVGSPTGPSEALATGAFCPVFYGTYVTLPPVWSWDPNEKNGPAGFGTDGFVTSAGEMAYTILFENKAEATAEAYRVVIHDTLSSVFEPATVVFGSISHDGFVAAREGNVLRWDIEGIELPPNVNPPEGEGFVTFTVRTREGLPSGTRIENRATIVFDQNPPITTNTAVNTLDYTPPVTSMLPLAAQTEASEVVVRWRSDDPEGGAGVGRVNVYGAVDAGGFQFVGSTSADSLAVPVETPGTYRFYALAVDHVGNAQTERPDVVATQVTIPVASDPQEGPPAFALYQNYPNPFSGSTTIDYVLPGHEAVELCVYDLLGRRVATLVEAVQPAGRHRVSWKTAGLASGVYFVQLRQGWRLARRSVLLVR